MDINAQQRANAALDAAQVADSNAKAAITAANNAAGAAASASAAANTASYAAASAATAASAAQTTADTASTKADTAIANANLAVSTANTASSNTATSAASASAAAASAASALQAAALAQNFSGSLTVPATALPYEVGSVTGGIATGVGGTPGTYTLTTDGAVPGFVVAAVVGSDGKVASYDILSRGLSTTNTVPVISWPADAGFTTAPTAPTAQVRVIGVGTRFEAPDSTNKYMLAWKNTGGVLTAVNGSDGVQIKRYINSAVDDIVNPVVSAITNIKSKLGSDLSDVTTGTIGSVFTSGNPANNDRIQMSLPLGQAGFISSISVGLAGTSTGWVMIFEPDGVNWRCVYMTAVTGVSGANTFATPGTPYTSASARVAYKRATGSTPYYGAGSGSTIYLNAADITAVGNVAPVAGAGLAGVVMSLAATLTYVPAPLTSRITANEGAIVATKSVISDSAIRTVTIGDVTDSTLSTSLTTCGGTPRFYVGGFLRSVKLRTNSAGTGMLILGWLDGDVVRIRQSWSVTVTAGVDTFTDAVFGQVPIRPGDAIFYAPVTSAALKYAPGRTGWRFVTTDGFTVGATPPVYQTNVGYAIEADIAFASPPSVRPSFNDVIPTVSTTFSGSARETGWALTGFTWSDGLVATATGWTAAKAIFTMPSNISHRRSRAVVRPAASTDAMGIFHDAADVEDYGGGVILNGATGALETYYVPANGAAVLADTVTLPVGWIVAGEDYVLEMTKRDLRWFVSVTRRATGEVYNITWQHSTGAGARYSARFHGSPGVVCLAGTPKIVSFEHCVLRCDPVIVITGDSNYEGIAVGNSDWAHAWPYMLDYARGRNDVILAAHSGDDSKAWLYRLYADLTEWRPRFCIIGQGSNDNIADLWRKNTRDTITICKALNIEPILVTYPPHGSYPERVAAYNADVLGGYFGRYRVLDIAWAVSLDHDRATINPDYYRSDNIHLNAAGHRAVLNQIVTDSPYLLDGIPNYPIPGPVAPGVWKLITGNPKLRVSGSGTVTIDTKDYDGTITTAVLTITATGVTTTTKPTLGDNVVAIRITPTSNVFVEAF